LQHTGFVAMNPDRHASSHYDYFQDLFKGDGATAEAHRKFYDEYNAVLDMDADYYLETIQTVFQEFKLVHGTWDVQGVDGQIERVRPQDIRHTALMTVEGELDDISGSGQTRAAQDLCSGIAPGNRQHLEVEGAGHYGIFSGRRWRDVVYPQVSAFIQRHALPQTAKAPKSPALAPSVAAPKATVKAAPKAAAKVAPKAIPKAIPKAAPPASSKATSKAATKVAPPTVVKTAAPKAGTGSRPATPPAAAKPMSAAAVKTPPSAKAQAATRVAPKAAAAAPAPAAANAKPAVKTQGAKTKA